MNQGPNLLAAAMLGFFGVVGLLLAMLWRNRPFRIGAGLLALGVFLWLVGVILVTDQTKHLKQYQIVHQWLTAPGMVTSSRVIGTRAIRPEIVYQYSVGGVTYHDSTNFDPPNFANRNATREAAEAVSHEYPAGKPVTIHYDPADPSKSRLKITPPWSVYGQLGFGGFLFGAGLFLTVGYFYSRRIKPSS